MFTGIIESTGTVIHNYEGLLKVSRPAIFEEVALGSSISISGVCLSVIDLTEEFLSFNVVDETLKCTNLGNKKEGDIINLERALPASGRFDGHMVQGHVDGVGTVIEPGENLTVELQPDLLRYVIHKGSVAIDGVSLTVTDVSNTSFSTALIPHTLEHTTLGSLSAADVVNIETDILVRTIASLQQ